MDSELRKRSSDLRAIADVRLVAIEDGPGRGQRLLLARNAAGIAFEIAVDRGFDLSSLSIRGFNIGWHSPIQMRFPAVDPGSEEGWGFLRNFDGFMVTCGLDHYSRPRAVDVAHYNHPHFDTKIMPLHGRIATERARLLRYGVDEGTGDIICEGMVRQASVFGESLELHRRITLPLAGTELRVDDRVTNRGFRPTRHAILYHLNFGYPFLDRDLKIAGLPFPLSEELRTDLPVPADDYGECVSVIDSADIAAGRPVSLCNPQLGISVGVNFSRRHLSKLAVWRAYQSGVFALGVEPRTEQADDRPLLQPGECCTHWVTISVSA